MPLQLSIIGGVFNIIKNFVTIYLSEAKIQKKIANCICKYRHTPYWMGLQEIIREVNYSGLKPEAYHTGVMKSMSVVWPSVLIL